MKKYIVLALCALSSGLTASNGAVRHFFDRCATELMRKQTSNVVAKAILFDQALDDAQRLYTSTPVPHRTITQEEAEQLKLDLNAMFQESHDRIRQSAQTMKAFRESLHKDLGVNNAQEFGQKMAALRLEIQKAEQAAEEHAKLLDKNQTEFNVQAATDELVATSKKINALNKRVKILKFMTNGALLIIGLTLINEML